MNKEKRSSKIQNNLLLFSVEILLKNDLFNRNEASEGDRQYLPLAPIVNSKERKN